MMNTLFQTARNFLNSSAFPVEVRSYKAKYKSLNKRGSCWSEWAAIRLAREPIDSVGQTHRAIVLRGQASLQQFNVCCATARCQ